MAMTAALVLSVAPGFGQELTVRRATRMKLKGGSLAEFRAAVQAEKAALTKMGYTGRQTWWTTVSGPSEVVLVRYYKNYAEMDEPGPQTKSVEVANARARAGKCIESQSTEIEAVIPELTQRKDMNTVPAFVRMLRTVVKPERLADYKALLKTDVAPHMKKFKDKLFLATEARFGGEATTVSTAMGMDSMAEFDKPLPLVQVMGQVAYDALLAKRAPMVLSTVVTIYRHQPDMSYLP